jgi:hypothetical protein
VTNPNPFTEPPPLNEGLKINEPDSRITSPGWILFFNKLFDRLNLVITSYVATWNSRSGEVLPEIDDYSYDMVTGAVGGPATSVVGHLVAFASTDGKKIKDSNRSINLYAEGGCTSIPKASGDNSVAVGKGAIAIGLENIAIGGTIYGTGPTTPAGASNAVYGQGNVVKGASAAGNVLFGSVNTSEGSNCSLYGVGNTASTTANNAIMYGVYNQATGGGIVFGMLNKIDSVGGSMLVGTHLVSDASVVNGNITFGMGKNAIATTMTNLFDDTVGLGINSDVPTLWGSDTGSDGTGTKWGIGLDPTLMTEKWNVDGNTLNTGSIKSSGGGVGYAIGAGGSVTQATNKATIVTLNKLCGKIITSGSTLNANTTTSFRFDNSFIEADDVIAVVAGGTGGTSGSYCLAVEPFGGGCNIYIRNITAGNLSEVLTLRFAIIKTVTS